MIKENLMEPHEAVVTAIKKESPCVKTFTVRFKDKRQQRHFSFIPGKFMMVSVFGAGEMPIGISSSPLRTDSLQLTVADVGNISHAMHLLKKGSVIGLRGPFGKPFPIAAFRKKNIVLVAGGLGLAPLRSIIHAVLPKHSQFGKLQLFFGARNPCDLIYSDELKQWQKARNFEIFLTVDKPDSAWKGNVGVVTSLFANAKIPAENTVAAMCGPQVMMHFASIELEKLGIPATAMHASLERVMHCGTGKCFHCNIGHRYACIDGPVMTVADMQALPKEG